MGRKSRNRAPVALSNTVMTVAQPEPIEESPVTQDEPVIEPAEIAEPSPFASVTVVTGLHHNGQYYEPGATVLIRTLDALDMHADGAVRINGLLYP